MDMDVIKKLKKFFFKTFLLSSANEKYIHHQALKTVLLPLKTDFLLVTLSFNDLELVALQHISLKKISDAYDHIVADNSSLEDQAQAIEAFCAKEGIGYVRLPQPNPGLDRSLSHGFSLNWIFYNLIKKLSPERFGFLESDVMVAIPGSFLKPWEGRDFWGVKMLSSPTSTFWRLWPGFCFFRREFYRDKALNFLPIRGIDTGGGNYRILKNMDTEHLVLGSEVLDEKIADDSNEIVQKFLNVVHLVGMSFKWSDPNTVNRKRDFAEALIRGVLPSFLPRKIVFLDRDGVINKQVTGEYVLRWDQFEFLPGAIEGLKLLHDANYEIYIITNQPAVGKGLMSEKDLAVIHATMKEKLRDQGIDIRHIYYCPHRDEDHCDCRKPQPGMLVRASRDYSIDLSTALFIGDSVTDVEAGKAVGCQTIVMKMNDDLRKTVLSLGG